MMPAMAQTARQTKEPIICHCRQWIGWRFPSGQVVPIGSRYIEEPSGRIRLECPKCRKRTTVRAA
jgi:hypothetical protein